MWPTKKVSTTVADSIGCRNTGKTPQKSSIWTPTLKSQQHIRPCIVCAQKLIPRAVNTATLDIMLCCIFSEVHYPTSFLQAILSNLAHIFRKRLGDMKSSTVSQFDKMASSGQLVIIFPSRAQLLLISTVLPNPTVELLLRQLALLKKN